MNLLSRMLVVSVLVTIVVTSFSAMIEFSSHRTFAAVKQAPAYAPPQQAAEAEPQPDRPFYGQSFHEGAVTSVYFYPEGTDGVDASATHIKFDNKDDGDLWLCGDQRTKIKPSGVKRRMMWTAEPNTACVTNWKFQ